MPMQPSPRAETARLLLPSLRFCIFMSPSSIERTNPVAARSRRRTVVDDLDRIQGAGITDKGQQLGDRVDQYLAVVADSEVCGNMPSQLWFTPAERSKHRERQKLSCLQVQGVACEVVSEA